MLNTDEEITDITNYIRDILVKKCNDKDVIEDLIQQTFANVIDNLNKFRGESKFTTWVYKICINTMYEYYRKDKSKKYETISLEQAKNEFAIDMDANIEEMYEQKENVEELHRYINCLGEPDYTIVQLKTKYDKNFCEIAKIFGQSENWARQRFHNAKEKIIKMKREEKMGEKKNEESK